MTDSGHDNKLDYRGLVAPGAAVVGGLAGAALDLFVPGSAGPFAAAALGPTIEHTILGVSSEFAHRQLAAREQARVGGAMAVAAIRINERLKDGEQLRDDGFLKGDGKQRSAGEELLEGVLLTAQREHEEKKVPFIGNLLAGISFDEEIDRGQANLLLRQAEEISYRQLSILALLGEIEIFAALSSPFRKPFVPNLREGAYRGRPPTDTEIGVYQEAWDLQVRSLAYVGPTAMDSSWVNPAEMRLQALGHSLYLSMELYGIEVSEMEDVSAFVT